jgi:hypothetical protein
MILPPSQIIGCFDISKFIAFSIHLDMHYVQIMNLEMPKQHTIWDQEST